MPGCAAYGCTNNSKKGYKMCYFPRDPVRRDAWIDAVNRPILKNARHIALCEIHFSKSDWIKSTLTGRKKLKSTSVPSVELPKTGRKKKEYLILKNHLRLMAMSQMNDLKNEFKEFDGSSIDGDSSDQSDSSPSIVKFDLDGSGDGRGGTEEYFFYF